MSRLTPAALLAPIAAQEILPDFRCEYEALNERLNTAERSCCGFDDCPNGLPAACSSECAEAIIPLYEDCHLLVETSFGQCESTACFRRRDQFESLRADCALRVATAGTSSSLRGNTIGCGGLAASNCRCPYQFYPAAGASGVGVCRSCIEDCRLGQWCSVRHQHNPGCHNCSRGHHDHDFDPLTPCAPCRSDQTSPTGSTVCVGMISWSLVATLVFGVATLAIGVVTVILMVDTTRRSNTGVTLARRCCGNREQDNEYHHHHHRHQQLSVSDESEELAGLGYSLEVADSGSLPIVRVRFHTIRDARI